MDCIMWVVILVRCHWRLDTKMSTKGNHSTSGVWFTLVTTIETW